MNTKTYTQIIIELDRNLLSHFTVSSWNAFLADLMAKNLISQTWSPGERPPPLGILLNLSHLRRPHYRLVGINLGPSCWLSDADFEGANLERATLGCCPRTNFKRARLAGAFFLGTISSCDFTDATGIEEAHWLDASYDAGNPPLGLPSHIMALCQIEPETPKGPREPENPAAEPTGHTVAPLNACITIHEIPME